MIEFDFSDLVEVEYEVFKTDECDIFGSTERVQSKISSIDYNAVVSDYLSLQEGSHWGVPLTPMQGDDEILAYCIERIVCYAGLYDKNRWEIKKRKYYYGEEIESVKFLGHAEVMQGIKDILEKSNSERIEAVLNLEYGYLLEQIKDLNWHVTTINKKNVQIGSKEHYANLDDFYVEQYKNRDLPRCIVIPYGNNKFRLIDGYHRLFASKDDTIKVIIGTKK